MTIEFKLRDEQVCLRKKKNNCSNQGFIIEQRIEYVLVAEPINYKLYRFEKILIVSIEEDYRC